jgi:hypothetical protein
MEEKMSYYEKPEPEFDVEFEANEEFENDEGDFEFAEELNRYDNEAANEEYEAQLVDELLNIQNEMEMEQFLGKLFKKAKAFIGSPAGQMATSWLKKVAGKALPALATAAGGYFGGPLGAKIGGQLGSSAANMLGLELEGLSPEGKAYEIGKRYVKLASSVANNLAVTRGPNPKVIATIAIKKAAKQYAPGLLRPRPLNAAKLSGRWIQLPNGNITLIMGSVR